MSTGFTVYIVLQFIATCGILFGIVHEERLVDFENKILGQIKKRLSAKSKKNSKNSSHHCVTTSNVTSDDLLHPTDCFDYMYSNVA